MFWWRTSSYDGGRMTSSVVSSCEVGEVTAGLADETTGPLGCTPALLGACWSGEHITTSYEGGRSAATLPPLRGPLLESCSRTSCRRLPLSRHARARAWRSSSARWIAVSMIAIINTKQTVPPMMYAATTIISRKPCISDRAKSIPVGQSTQHTKNICNNCTDSWNLSKKNALIKICNTFFQLYAAYICWQIGLVVTRWPWST